MLAKHAAPLHRLIAALGLLAAGAHSAAAGSGSGTLAGETFIHSRFTGNNNGGCGYVTVGRDNSAGLMRGLIEFNLPQPVPGYAGRATVTGAFLNNVTVRNLPNGTPGTAETYFVERLSGAFVAGNGCGAPSTNNYNAGVACGSVTIHGATWSTSNCATPWTAGGAVSGSAVPSTLAGSTLSWDSGGAGTTCLSQPQLCGDVQAFIDAGVATGGWRIRNSESVNGHAQALNHSGTLSFDWSCKAGFLDTGTTCTTCTAAAKAACLVTCPSTGGTCTSGQPSGNTCNDSGPPSSTYTCTCNNPAYTGTGSTACTDFNACTGSPCASGGDTSSACIDAVAPNVGYSCTCNTGFTFNGATCVSQCKAGSNPCNVNGDNASSCTVVGSGGWTCGCSPGYVSSGGTTPACVNFNACTSGGGNSACVTSCPSTGGSCTAGQPSGNSCNDLPPPSLSYTCTCSNGAYAGTGSTSCTDKNECSSNPCNASGDGAATCTDAVAPNIGHTCTCSAGFIPSNQGTSSAACVDACNATTRGTASDPCGHGTCTVSGSAWTCACQTGYVSSGGSQPSCVDFNGCTMGGGNTSCIVTCPSTGGTCVAAQPSGNGCNDLPPPSLSYTCTCSNPAYTGTGTMMCGDLNECASNPCNANGDATATCTDAVAPNTGHMCTCDTGFFSNGTSCVSKCPGTIDPCGNGGTCASTGAGQWTCNCPTGYASSGGSQPTCVAVVCGDGVVSGSEQCDKGAANGTAGSCCSASCTFVAATTQCLAPTGPCGLGAACTGSSATCPAETFKPSTTQCSSATDCQTAGTCNGSAAACPAQLNVADGTSCSGGSGTCIAGACVPNDMAHAADMTLIVDLNVPESADMTGGAAPDMASGGSGTGCGCFVGGAQQPSPEPWAVLSGLALVLVIRRQRHRRE